MTYLSCNEILQIMKDLGHKLTFTREYAFEFRLKNGQYVYVKRLQDTKKITPEPSRLMIHPVFEVLKEDLQKIDHVAFNFSEKGNMNSAFAHFPTSSQSQCEDNPTQYGIGVNFSNRQALLIFLDFIQSL